MIILEGPDCCGKGTVAKALKSLLRGWSYRHHTKPPVEDSYSYFSWFLADSQPAVVVDRFHYSEPIYGEVYRHGANFTPHEWRLLELSLMSRNTIVLHMTDTFGNIASRWKTEREMFSLDPIRNVVEMYEKLMSGATIGAGFKTYLPRASFRLPELVEEDGQPTDLLKHIAIRACDQTNKAYHLYTPSIGMGSPYAKFMLIGEEPGNPDPKSLRPQVPFDFGHSADVLWPYFDEIGLRWWEGYYTNASAFKSWAEFDKYIQLFPEVELVLTLGKRAQDLVFEGINGSGNPYRLRNVSHPSYLRRLSSEHQAHWRALLKQHLNVYCHQGPENKDLWMHWGI